MRKNLHQRLRFVLRNGDDDTDDAEADRISEEAGADWLAEQGFDRKD